MRLNRTHGIMFLTGLLAVFVVATASQSSQAAPRGVRVERTINRSQDREADRGDDRRDLADGSEEDPSAPSDVPANRNLFSVLREGGAMMVPMFACSFLLLVFMFERIISLRRGRVIPAPFVKKLQHQLREGKLDREGALELCKESQTPVSEVAAAAIRKWGRPSVELEQAVIDAEERAASGLRSYLRLFNGIANIAPLMGLLGTTFGMIHTFGDIAKGDAGGRSEIMAGGISEALLSTAGGLLVAIPAMCCYLFFVSRVEKLVVEIDEVGQDVVSLVSAEALSDSPARRANRRGAAA